MSELNNGFALPSQNFAIVILNHFPEYARQFIASIRQHHKVLPPIAVVTDRHNEGFGPGVIILQGKEDFIYSRNSNIGIEHFPGKDIILCNDDLTCVENDFFPRLESITEKWPKCGVMAPLIDGGVGNLYQQASVASERWKQLPEEICITGKSWDSMPVCFCCVYLKRSMIDAIGLLDEKFESYGYDDNDMCIRARQAGFWTMITRELVIRHGSGGHGLNRGYNWSCSFAREKERPNNEQYYLSKHKPAEKVST